MARHLPTNPHEWGDPDYHLVKEGARVYHRIVDLIIIRYAVYEVEEEVYVLEVLPVTSAWGDE